jgi:hypothetical protein
MRYLGKVLFLAASLVAAQSSPSSSTAKPEAQTQPEKQAQPEATAKPESIATVVKQQFGSTFSVVTTMPTSFIVSDFDADGVEDVAIVADSKDPLPDSYDFKYEVADPYNSYFGYGNPRITAAFNSSERLRNHSLLVIFGAGKEGWRSATPKAKFVLVNIPFDTVEAGRMLTRKKNKPPIFVIKAIESQLMDSAVWYDVKKKKWHWEPGGTRD